MKTIAALLVAVLLITTITFSINTQSNGVSGVEDNQRIAGKYTIDTS